MKDQAKRMHERRAARAGFAGRARPSARATRGGAGPAHRGAWTRIAPTRTGVSLSIAAVVAACGITGPDDSLLDDLERNRRLWEQQGSSSYVYVVQRQCFCALRGPVRITVTDGTVASRVYQGSGEPVGSESGALFPAVEGLFAFIEDALERDPADVSVTYDTATGVPLAVFVDYARNVSDEEVGYAVLEAPEPLPR